MKRQISSDLTLFYKRGFPLICVFLLCIGILGEITSNRMNLRETIILMGVISVLLFFIIRGAQRLKIVEIDDEKIYIRDLSKELILPIEVIKTVDQTFWGTFHPETVNLQLNENTSFGSTIYFMPKSRLINLGPHPIVIELRKHTDFNLP